MKTLLTILCLCPWALAAQTPAKYLQGAVPLVDSRVTFTRVIPAPALAPGEIYTRLQKMTNERFSAGEETNGSTLYTNNDEGVIICRGNEYLVFTQKALVLDRALVDYQATYTCKPGECQLEITRVRYTYGEETKTRYTAEEWITDQHAYDKKRDKLLRGSDKFRVKTIDLVDELAALAAQTLQTSAPVPPPVITPAAPRENTLENTIDILPTEI
ncbi:MAG: DUF4468 domain-containing protein, partial [Odoribacteraceae bacterium]|nr:DUF4468 domain-containing protein [Odoribacteraceae bacterium]